MAEPSVFMLAAWTNDPAGWAAVETGLRLVTAAVLGGLIGLERGVHGRSAGLRTQMLVAVGAALAMVVNLRFADVFVNPDTPISIDPSRVAYGVMGGVGFLGAGAIMRFGIGIRGLTTAASLWCTAAVGLAAGFGLYGIAAFTAGVVLVVLWVLRFLDQILPRAHERQLTLVTGGPVAEAVERFEHMLVHAGLDALQVSIRRQADESVARITFRVILHRRADLMTLLRVIDQTRDVHGVTLE
ncbi:MAG: MgtC/SapB family protein [Planctomycetes bacterium]|nr:MgtC/SapB family protein [Planctomycetota bacterium]